MDLKVEILAYLYNYKDTREDDLISYCVDKFGQSVEGLKSVLDEMIACGIVCRVLHQRLEPLRTYLRFDNPGDSELAKRAMDRSLEMSMEDLKEKTVEPEKASTRVPISRASGDEEKQERIKATVKKLREIGAENTARTVREEFEKSYPDHRGPFPPAFLDYFWASHYGIISRYRDIDEQLELIMTIVESKVQLDYEINRPTASPGRPKAKIMVRVDMATKQRLEQAAAAEGIDYVSYVQRHFKQLRESGQISTEEDAISARKENEIGLIEIWRQDELPPTEKLVEVGLDYIKKILNQNEDVRNMAKEGQYSTAHYISRILLDFWVEKFPDYMGGQALGRNPLASLRFQKAEDEISRRWMMDQFTESLPREERRKMEEFEKKPNEEIVDEICAFARDKPSIFDRRLQARHSLIKGYLSQEYHMNDPATERYIYARDWRRMRDLHQRALARLNDVEIQSYNDLRNALEKWAEQNHRKPIDDLEVKRFLKIKGLENTPGHLRQDLIKDVGG